MRLEGRWVFTRTTGWLIVPLWAASMGWLVAHDVLPGWVAQDPPRMASAAWLHGAGGKTQCTIAGEQGRLGTLWTTYLADAGSIERYDDVWIERLPVPLAPLRIRVTSTFTPDGVLDEFTLVLESAETLMRLHGERFHADFSFTFQANTVRKAFKVPLVDGGIVSGAFNPFSQLSGLRLGQSWRMQVFNPVAALTGIGDRFIPMLVKVTGERRISTGAWSGNCFVVESGRAKAFVDADGVVQMQEMTLPVLGTLRIVREPAFDDAARRRARRRSFGR